MRRSSTLLPMPWETPVCLILHSPSQNSSFFILIFTSLAGCTLLDVDAGKSTNRTVYTFVGSPDAVVEGAFNACKVAKELIDMRKHHGEHPRMGACDVCPFIPVQVSPLHLADYSPLGCDYGWLRWDLQEVRQEGCGGAWHSSVCPSVLLRPLGISTNTLPMSATERHCLRFVLVNMSIWRRRSSSLSGSLILVLPACSSSLPFIPSRICAYLGCDCHRCS